MRAHRPCSSAGVVFCSPVCTPYRVRSTDFDRSHHQAIRETAPMARATIHTTRPDTLEIEYETFGSPDDPALLLVMGFAVQLIHWDTELCERLADAGRYVIRFDNRDIGLSSKLDGEHVDPMAVLRCRARRRTAPGGAVHAVRHGQRRRSACSTPSASSGPTSWVRRWAG